MKSFTTNDKGELFILDSNNNVVLYMDENGVIKADLRGLL